MKITPVKARKQKPDFSKLGFGKFFTDYMLTMEYDAARRSPKSCLSTISRSIPRAVLSTTDREFSKV